jgi:atypical dual specificity phosphatase
MNPLIAELHFGFLGPYRVAGMGEPWSMKMEDTHWFLREQGLGAILTLTEDDLYGARHRAAGFLHWHEPVDDTEPPGRAGMSRALDFIDACLKKETGVAVHCMEGRGRTGTVLCAWLGVTEALGAEDAVRRIFTLRPCTVLTPRQRSFLHQYLGGGR